MQGRRHGSAQRSAVERKRGYQYILELREDKDLEVERRYRQRGETQSLPSMRTPLGKVPVQISGEGITALNKWDLERNWCFRK